jgi:5'(3')-deoxyribonucleotidase
MKNTFYLDMDGVIADWDTGAELFLGIPFRSAALATGYKLTKDEWNRLRNHGRIFRTLPIMAQADQLVALARQYRDQLGWDLLFLTAIPHGNDVPWAFSDKVMWAQEHFPDIPVHFGPYAVDKQAHCQAGDILVDDRQDNCERWRAAGGTAFKVSDRTLAPTLDHVKQDLSKRLSLQSMAALNASTKK